jgi:hypothetical protein
MDLAQHTLSSLANHDRDNEGLVLHCSGTTAADDTEGVYPLPDLLRRRILIWMIG